MTLRLGIQLVREIREKATKTLQKGLHITTPQLTDKFSNIKSGIRKGNGGIKGSNEVEETILDLFIGKPERIQPELRIIFLDGQITALENHGNGVVYVGTVIA